MPRDIAIAIADTDHHMLGMAALRQSVAGVDPAQVLVFSDRPEAWPGYEVLRIPTLTRIEDYNRLITGGLAEHLRCGHVLVVQYDGFVLDPAQFAPLFLHYDYLGAPWPQFADHAVGNGGFSLRSRRLVEAVAALPYDDASEAEDLFICRRHGAALARSGLRFAPREVAAHFSVEYPLVPWPTFGFHGIFHLPGVYRHALDFLVEHLSERVLRTRSAFLLPAIAQLSPAAALRYRARLAALSSNPAEAPAPSVSAAFSKTLSPTAP